MRLIIGGREQGKLSFAVGKYKIPSDGIYDCSRSGPAEMSKAKCIYKLHEYVRRLVSGSTSEETDSEIEAKLSSFKNADFNYGEIFGDHDFSDVLIARFRTDSVIICDEVGLGIVPADKEERIYRQAVGRLCCRLAERADSVERVFCGIGMRIK